MVPRLGTPPGHSEAQWLSITRAAAVLRVSQPTVSQRTSAWNGPPVVGRWSGRRAAPGSPRPAVDLAIARRPLTGSDPALDSLERLLRQGAT
jgi:hypothetical protein